MPSSALWGASGAGLDGGPEHVGAFRVGGAKVFLAGGGVYLRADGVDFKFGDEF
jgi:hypothetical protein